MSLSTTLRRSLRNHLLSSRPDLAELARTLGADIRAGHHGLEALMARCGDKALRWRLYGRDRFGATAEFSCMPAGGHTQLHDHADLWGVDLVVEGALEVESWRLGPDGPLEGSHQRTWLGPGDALWFEPEDRYAHRSRNLSNTRPVLMLHVMGGALDQLRYLLPSQERWVDSTRAAPPLEPLPREMAA